MCATWNRKNPNIGKNLLYNPCLYIKSDPKHMDKIFIENVWRCISEKMSLAYPGTSSKNVQLDFLSLKRIFRNERLRVLRKKSGSGVRKESMWDLYKNHQFLKHHVEIRSAPDERHQNISQSTIIQVFQPYPNYFH